MEAHLGDVKRGATEHFENLSANSKEPSALENAPGYTHEEERRVRRKFDKHIMSLVFLIFTLSYLDRANIGNANAAGLSRDMGLSTPQYQWLLTMFYIGYVVFEFTTIAWKVFRPKYWACSLLLCWGAAAMGQGACKTWAQLMVCRFFLGTFEAMMTCGIPLYMSFFYFRDQLGLRIGILLSSSPLGSAWAGALAYGITKAKTSLHPWRLLLIVEGAPTIAAVPILFFLLVDGPLQANFLTGRDKEVARLRIESTTIATRGPEVEHEGRKLNTRDYFSAFLDYKNYIVASMHFATNVSISSISVFTPIIIKEMGFSSINAQGLSAPPYILAAICVLIVTFMSDHMRSRGIFVSGCSLVGSIGYLLQATSTGIAPRYIGVYLSAAGLFSAAACNVTWLLNNQRQQSKRGAALAILQVIGQCGSFLGTRLFPASAAPYYRTGMWTCFGFLIYVSIMSAVYSLVLRWENRKFSREDGFGAEAVDDNESRWRNVP